MGKQKKTRKYATMKHMLKLRDQRLKEKDRLKPTKKEKDPSALKEREYSMVYMCHIFLIPSIIVGHLGWFQGFAVVNSAAINIRVHASL
uniref:Uncharacterized protein n=1 Tax=Pongo abelii TaxID=9601 RepID=A0A8I5T418_PONAB